MAPLPHDDRSQRERERSLAYSLLCRVLDGIDPAPQLAHDALGAPYLPGHPGLAVSISHCRQAVAVALNPAGSIGIDIECRRKINPELIRRVCTRQEQAAILASDDPEMEFLRYWTRKEAVLKCRGTGIRGFGSMQQALADSGCHVYDIPCGIPDTTAAIAITMAV